MKKYFFITLAAVLFLFSIAIYQYVQFHDGRLHVIFCDVGQGDAILVKSPANKLILIDGGSDKSVLACLSRHMPFWEKRLDLMLLTHPHADHHNGLYYVLEQYAVGSFATEDLRNSTAGFRTLLDKLAEQKVSQQVVFADDAWQLPDGVTITIVGPTQEFLHSTDPDGTITDSAESGSLITEVVYGELVILLTGDAPVDELAEVVPRNEPVDILQSPHHGSKTGMSSDVLERLQPQLIAISVGLENKYGHPSASVLALYKAFSLPVLRTDQRGDIEIVSNGREWWVK